MTLLRIKNSRLSAIIGTGAACLVLGAFAGYALPSPIIASAYKFEAARETKFAPDACASDSAFHKASVARQRSLIADCAKESEDHRLITNDLIQQTRAADAAHEQASIAFKNLWLSYIQMIGGSLTLVAAALAALYAREAAKQAKRGADAAHDDLSHSKNVSELQLRPYIKFSVGDATVKNVADETHPRSVRFGMHFLNVGETPAIDLSFKYNIYLTFEKGTPEEISKTSQWQRPATLVKNDEEQAFIGLLLTDMQHDAIIDGSLSIDCHGEVKYGDIYGINHEHYFEASFSGEFEKPIFHLANERIVSPLSEI